MAATDLGKVGMIMRGDWSSSLTYEEMDVVSYNGGTYIAKQAVPANTLPTDTTYWQSAISHRGTRTVFFNASNPIVVAYPVNIQYYSFLVKSGLVQGIGNVFFMIIVEGTTVTVKNVITGATVTSVAFDASLSDNIVTITTAYASPSYVDIIL